MIIAVWAKDMYHDHLYQAEEIAEALGYDNSGQENSGGMSYMTIVGISFALPNVNRAIPILGTY